MSTKDQLEAAYQDLRLQGVELEDLHAAVAKAMRRGLNGINNIAAYLARTAFRNRRKRQRPALSSGKFSEPCWTPPDSLIREEVRMRVRQEILRLAPREQAVAELWCFNGMKGVEIARQLRWPLGAVRNLIFRARRRLAESLADETDSV